MNIIIDNSLVLFASIFIAALGAIQPGLVNLTVANASYQKKPDAAKSVSKGAAVIEVSYGFIALLLGSYIQQYLNNNRSLRITIFLFLLSLGFFFFFKKQQVSKLRKTKQNSFLRGMLLNLISFQVFLYWLIAITILLRFIEIPIQLHALIVFALGIYGLEKYQY